MAYKLRGFDPQSGEDPKRFDPADVKLHLEGVSLRTARQG
jgi:hypothetical protein